MIRKDAWLPSDKLSLEPNALTAAKEIERNLALTAGPGAGKTELLAQRADFLLRAGVCRYPQRILAISFKVDACQNLRARVRRRCGADLAHRFDSHTFHGFAKRLIDRFRLTLKGVDALNPDFSVGPRRVQHQSITFDDMVPLAIKIARDSLIARNAVRCTYTHVFLDEFQDCTTEQYELIARCFLGTNIRLTAVGDTKQRIMGWAGAMEGIFKVFSKDFAATPLNLYQNFRSKPRLRRMQNSMVRQMDPAAAVPDEALQGDEGEITVLSFDDEKAEALALANMVDTWIKAENINPAEIAVLVSKQQSLYCNELCKILEACGIAYREEDRSQDLASEPISRVIIDFMLVVTENYQSLAYQRFLDTVIFTHNFDDEKEYRTRSRVDGFIAHIRKGLSQKTYNLTDRSGVQQIVHELVGTVGRDGLIALSSDYAHGARFQERVAATVDRIYDLISHNSSIKAALEAFAGDNAIRIMSIHKSKGLEFDSVIVLGVENETFWGNINEERSAYFVGISRAKRRLLLTVAKTRSRPEGAKRWSVSRTPQIEFLGYAP